MSLVMEYGVQPANSHLRQHLSGYGYFGAPVQNTQATYQANNWTSTLDHLWSQKRYLEHLLSKTATTLNALRDKQGRNERLLGTNPTPRSKKKKVLQSRWRTDKTIKTCENEERVILECLQVCTNNIHTLSTIIRPAGLSSTAVLCLSPLPRSSHGESEATRFDWNGWTNEGGLSPFQKQRQHTVMLDEVPPEVSADGSTQPTEERRRPRPLARHGGTVRVAFLTPVPPNTADSSLSPEAACFEPSVTHVPHDDAEVPKELDKLSISGLLASKRMHMIYRRRFSDAAIGHVFRSLPGRERPPGANTQGHGSWSGPSSQLGDPRCTNRRAKSI